MKAISLTANPRVLTKTIGSKKLRNAGSLPGVVYGNGEPETVELEAKQFEKAVKSTVAALHTLSTNSPTHPSTASVSEALASVRKMTGRPNLNSKIIKHTCFQCPLKHASFEAARGP